MIRCSALHCSPDVCLFLYPKSRLRQYRRRRPLRKEIRDISLDGLNGLPLEFSEKSIIGNIKSMVQTEYGYIVRHIWNGTPGWSTPLYGIYDRDWNIVDTSDVKYPAGGYNTRFPFSCVDGNVYLAFIGSDTVFKADGERIVPGIVYDFGKSDFPAEIKYNLVKCLEYFQEHPDGNTRLFHNSTLVSAGKILASMNTAGETLLMVNDLRSGESTFYRILDGNGEPAYLYYLFNAPDGTARGIFMANDGENPSVYDLSSL